MTRKWHQAIIPIAAIVGAQIPGMFQAPHPAQSSSCLQWASEALNGVTASLQPHTNPSGMINGLPEGEYNQYREIFHSDAVRAVDAPAVASQNQADAPTPPPADAPAAASGSGGNYPPGMSQADYDEYMRRHPYAAGY